MTYEPDKNLVKTSGIWIQEGEENTKRPWNVGKLQDIKTKVTKEVDLVLATELSFLYTIS